MQSNRVKLTVLAASLVIAIGVSSWVVYQRYATPPMIEVVDNSAEVLEALDRSQQDGGSIPPLSPDVMIERPPWTKELAGGFFPTVKNRRSGYVFDSVVGIRRTPHLDYKRRHPEHPKGQFQYQTNSVGMRDDELLEDPDLRILFTGDSQTEGVCATDESFVNLLESRLRGDHPGRAIESVNAALGGTSPWYYLDILEASLDLEPDLFVPVFYGGNDFFGVMALERFYRGRGRPNKVSNREGSAPLGELPSGLGSQELRQIEYFLFNPEDRGVAVETWTAIAMEMSRRCEAHGIGFFPVYLPPPLVTQDEAYADVVADLEVRANDLATRLEMSNELADAWIEKLAGSGVTVIDLRGPIAAVTTRLYWDADRHLNVEGQSIAAGVLYDELADRASGILDSKD